MPVVEPILIFNSKKITNMSKREIDPVTGLPERSFDVEDFLEAKNIPSWSKPKGAHIF